jgi:tellurite methyltransferase
VAKRSLPSKFLINQLGAIRAAQTLGAVVDIACGRGRHALAVGDAGIPVLGIDRNRDFLTELREAAALRDLPVQIAQADLENPSEIPLRTRSCGAVMVFRFLNRALAPAIGRVLAPGGLLIYETFTAHQRDLGAGPRNPDYLLEPGELPGLFPDLDILEHWEGLSEGTDGSQIARLAARAKAGA